MVSVSQLCACITVHHEIWWKEDVLCLGVILITNAFSSNLFQTIFYYMPSLGIPLGSIIVQKRPRAGGGKSAYWGLCNNVENVCFELTRPKGIFF